MQERPPLDVERLRRRQVRPDGFVTALDVVESTVSTNSDLLTAASAGAPSGTVLIAEHQRLGRGRFDRTWTAPPRAGLLFSVLVRPDGPAHRWGWLPLLAGLAVRAGVGQYQPDDYARLKWPNDLLVGPERRKAGGILVQAAGAAAVIGIGVNVDQSADELPVDTATSLRIASGQQRPDREALLSWILGALQVRYLSWQRSGGDSVASHLVEEYEQYCATLGQPVRVERPAGAIEGLARAVDSDGSLLVESADGVVHTLVAGDVIHLRDSSR